MKRCRVAVAMSGGVDSSVAAALLKEKGYEVIGITMCFSASGETGLSDDKSEFNRKRPGCCSLNSIDDARRVAHKLGIKHYVVNMRNLLERYVIKDFLARYLSGMTPNPCIVCNQYLKFGELLNKVVSLDARFLATGHYARVIKSGGELWLGKARDNKKDQSYFLYRLSQKQLKHILFPIGGYKKEEVRVLARKFALPVADKVASQEICFMPNDDYRQFLKSRVGIKINPGPVVDSNGKIAGMHNGIAYYTVGQRGGLGIAKGYPVYITKIDARRNLITIGRKDDAMSSEFIIKDLFLPHKTIKKRIALKVKIRYNHIERNAEITPTLNKIRVKFKEPQFAITPGQAGVFYSNNKVVGGGVIEKVLD